MRSSRPVGISEKCQNVWDGNQDLLEYEQAVTLQNGAYAANPAFWANVTNSTFVQLGLLPAINSPIPGDTTSFQAFRQQPGVKDQSNRPIAPNVSFANFNARWAWIVQKQMPAYQTWSSANPRIDIKKLLSGGYK